MFCKNQADNKHLLGIGSQLVDIMRSSKLIAVKNFACDFWKER
jgi:hypothetical protein